MIIAEKQIDSTPEIAELLRIIINGASKDIVKLVEIPEVCPAEKVVSYNDSDLSVAGNLDGLMKIKEIDQAKTSGCKFRIPKVCTALLSDGSTRMYKILVQCLKIKRVLKNNIISTNLVWCDTTQNYISVSIPTINDQTCQEIKTGVTEIEYNGKTEVAFPLKVSIIEQLPPGINDSHGYSMSGKIFYGLLR